MKNTSPQATRTKTFLKNAFIEMVHKKGFSNVTVTDIVENAQYNRSTFYMYYQNIPHLVEELMAEKYEHIQHYSVSKYHHKSRIEVNTMTTNSFDLLYYIYDHRHYFTLLLLEDTLPYLHQQLPEAIFTLLTTHFDIQYGVKVTDDYAQKRYMAYGTAGLITDWIANDFDTTPHEMTQRLIGILKTMAQGFIVSDIAPHEA